MDKMHKALPSDCLEEIARQLISVGYPNITSEYLKQIVSEGISEAYSQIVAWLSNQIKNLYDLECFINPISNAEDVDSFTLEISTFLKEICCVNSHLTEGSLESRFVSMKSKLLLIDYLITELQTAKICNSEGMKKQSASAMSVEIPESLVAKDLRNMLMSLGLSKPPPTVTSAQLFTKVEEKILQCQTSGKPLELVNPLFVGVLTEKQWYQLNNLQDEMQKEYCLRRSMLLSRLDVTVESFYWSDRLKDKANIVKKLYSSHRATMISEPDVDVSKLLSADTKLLEMEATSTGKVREKTRSSVNKVIIGEVPDRGGRTNELAPPPPEVPSWQQSPNIQRGNYRGASDNKGVAYGKEVNGSQSDGFRKSGDNRSGSYGSHNNKAIYGGEPNSRVFSSPLSPSASGGYIGSDIGITPYGDTPALHQAYYVDKRAYQTPYDPGVAAINVRGPHFAFQQGIGGYGPTGDFQRFENLQNQSDVNRDGQRTYDGSNRHDGRSWQERGRGRGGRRGGRRC